jgi:fused signal recognition particle receptor
MKFLETLAQTFANKPIDWDDLEHALIRADLGVAMTQRIIKRLQEIEAWSLLGIKDVVKVAREEITRVLPETSAPLRALPGKPCVILIVGVNGTGKTTSTAKLAHFLVCAANCGASVSDASAFHRNALQDRQWSRREPSDMDGKAREGSAGGGRPNHHVRLVAADTFRAAAIEQLGIWAGRLGVEMVRGQYSADPAALCYDAYQKAAKEKIDFVLCDTAGRVHTKSNLMAELQKVKRTLAKQDASAPHETLLVVDATTGGNALSQAREFHKALGLTGLIVTKLDGSGKGGVVVAIQNELGVPTRFVGTGEKIDDFAPFDAHKFVAEML